MVHANSTSHDSDDIRETTFNESSTSTVIGASGLLSRQLSSDPKLEKKVTFARLLSKMSAEITSGHDIDVRLRLKIVSQLSITNRASIPHHFRSRLSFFLPLCLTLAPHCAG
jgi:hypothetical protein